MTFGRRKPYNERLVVALNELIDEQQELIEAQQAHIEALDLLVLAGKRTARDAVELAVETLDCPTPVSRECLAKLARELGYSVARDEEHSL